MLEDMGPADQKKRATYQDVLDAPEDKVAEVIDGEFHLSPRPAAPHAAVGSSLFGELQPPFGRGRGGPGGWVFLFEPELHFEDDIVVPDLAAWRQERMAVVPDAAYFTTPPDWICEVISTSTERRDRIGKLPIYARAGVGFAWLVNPRLRMLEAYRSTDGQWTIVGLYKDTDRARIEPFDAIELDLATLWAESPLPSRASEQPGHYDHW
jgi:Uma2 family endonuclease